MFRYVIADEVVLHAPVTNGHGFLQSVDSCAGLQTPRYAPAGTEWQMPDDFVSRLRQEIADAEHISRARLNQIELALTVRPTAELWVLRGDALQLSDDYDPDEVERSYLAAMEIDPASASAYESMGEFVLADRAQPRRAIWFLEKAISLGAGEFAHQCLRIIGDDLAESDWER